MKLVLNRQKREKKSIKKEVKKMKKICILNIVAFFLFAGLNAFAVASPIIDTTRDSTIVIEYYYNAYGVAIGSTQVTTTTTRTEDEEGGWSETVSVSTAESTWKGGSLKIDSATGYSETTGSQDSFSRTDFETNYEYNSDGQLVSVSGNSHAEGDRGNDDGGQAIGTFESDVVDSYIVNNGQALRVTSVTTGTNYGSDGTVTSTFETINGSTYELIGGSWNLKETVSVGITEGEDGSTESVIRTTTYTRGANGVLTGVSQTAEGERTMVSGDGGTITQTLDEAAYVADFVFDAEVGWYLSYEKIEWVDTTPVHDGSDNDNDYGDPYNTAVQELEAAGLPTDEVTVEAYLILKEAQANGWLASSSWDVVGVFGEYGLNFSAINGDGMAIHHAMDQFGLHGNDQGEFAYTIGDDDIAKYLSKF